MSNAITSETTKFRKSSADINAKIEQRLAHIKKWQASGISQNTYCRQFNIPISSFSNWKKLLLEGTSVIKSPAKKFIPVKIIKDASIPAETSYLPVVIKLLNGHVVQLPTQLGVERIAQIMRILRVQNA